MNVIPTFDDINDQNSESSFSIESRLLQPIMLGDLFIIENSEDYTEETLSESEVQTKSNGGVGVIDGNLREALTAVSFVLTGNGDELRTEDNSPLTKRTVTTWKNHCVLIAFLALETV
jgi:hypothetical protein